MIPLGRKILLCFSLFVAILGSVSVCHGETLSHLFEKAHITLPQRPLEAHDFVLPDVNGNQLSLKDLRGKIVFLNIWAIWCAPCREEMPSIERLYQRFKGRDFTILAVSIDMADTEFVKAFKTETAQRMGMELINNLEMNFVTRLEKKLTRLLLENLSWLMKQIYGMDKKGEEE